LKSNEDNTYGRRVRLWRGNDADGRRPPETRDLTVSADKAIEEIGERSRELERWDFTPTVEASDTQGVVTFCIYSPFGGFMKIKETFRIASFERIAMETVAEIPYECGVYF